jgi:hypothetical protein
MRAPVTEASTEPVQRTVTANQRSTIREMSGSAGHPKGRIGWTVAVGKQLDDLLPGRSLLVKDVGVDEHAVRVRYEIRPPILERPAPTDSTWLLHGTDELGNRYESAGGAFGLSADGTFTEGVHSLQPLPAPEVSFLDLGFIGPGELEGERPRHVIRVQLE